MGKNQKAALRQLAFLAMTGFFGEAFPLNALRLRENRRAMIGSGWIAVLTIAGTLSAIAAIAINEGFVSGALLVLTIGEWELLAVTFYVIAILLYLFAGHHSRSRAMTAPVLRVFRKISPAFAEAVAMEEHDASYVTTLEEATA